MRVALPGLEPGPGPKAARAVRAVLAAVLIVPLGAACGSVRATVDCGKSALRITGDVQDVSAAVTNVGNLVDDKRRRDTSEAIAELRGDLGKFGKGNGGADQRKAADDLAKAARNVQTASDTGQTPDMKPLLAAAGLLTKACASGSR